MLQTTENPDDQLLNSCKVAPHNHSTLQGGGELKTSHKVSTLSEALITGDVHNEMLSSTEFSKNNSVIKSNTKCQTQNDGIDFVGSTAEYEHVPPNTPEHDGGCEKVTSSDVNLSGSKVSESLNTQSINESAIDKEAGDSDTSSEKNQSAKSTTLETDSTVHFSTVDSSGVAHSESTSSVDKNALNGNHSEELPSAETVFDNSLNSTEVSANVFFPKGKICVQKFHECKVLEDTGQPDTNVSTPTPAERLQWVPMHKKYLQKEGFRLGINPGTFYSSKAGCFVEVPNGINYEIILTNENPVPCNVDVHIDNGPIPVISFRLNPGKPRKFDGPTFCENKFVFLRSKDAPATSGIKRENANSGVIQAIFTPQKVETLRPRTESEPVVLSRGFTSALEKLGIERNAGKLRSYSSDGTVRGFDISSFCQGGTALRGEQTKKAFKKADSMEVDETRRVVLRLRLVARTGDPCVPCEEDICSMFPPSIEELLASSDAL